MRPGGWALPARALLAQLAVVSLLACTGTLAPTNKSELESGTYVEPQPQPAGLTACDTRAGLALISALFAALNAQDFRQLAALFSGPDEWSFARPQDASTLISHGGGIEVRPAPAYRAQAARALAVGTPALQRLYPDAGAWEVTLVPTIDAALEAGLTSGTEVDALSQDQLPRILDQVRGVHFTVRSELSGSAGWVEHKSPAGAVQVREIDLGGPMWRATGPRLEHRGRMQITGGGKVAVYCEGQTLKRVLLSPLVIH